MFSRDQIEIQRKKVFGEPNQMELNRPCTIRDGIVKLSADEIAEYAKIFDQYNGTLSFFIPASGTGSRMFQFLFEFLSDDKHENEIDAFIDQLNKYSFYDSLSESIKTDISSQKRDKKKIIEYLLFENGLGFSKRPKGLIPFHRFNDLTITAFQEHLLQGNDLKSSINEFQFTIQKEFEDFFIQECSSIEKLLEKSINVTFSEQDPSTNSVAFNEKIKEPLVDEDGKIITRPSGHGSLLGALNNINSELIFIKNIDNIQHFTRKDLSNTYWKVLAGILLDFKSRLCSLSVSPSLVEFEKLNEKYNLIDKSIMPVSQDQLTKLLNKPLRVCGMVKNEGQPGGGPFWVLKNGRITKQIVEKAEISNSSEQQGILNSSTHFNPVMIVASPYSAFGRRIDLFEHRCDDAYIIVRKSQDGSDISYLEHPGLWNGSMCDWLTVFIEIPSSIFSPVKSITDLMNEAHQELT